MISILDALHNAAHAMALVSEECTIVLGKSSVIMVANDERHRIRAGCTLANRDRDMIDSGERYTVDTVDLYGITGIDPYLYTSLSFSPDRSELFIKTVPTNVDYVVEKGELLLRSIRLQKSGEISFYSTGCGELFPTEEDLRKYRDRIIYTTSVITDISDFLIAISSGCRVHLSPGSRSITVVTNEDGKEVVRKIDSSTVRSGVSFELETCFFETGWFISNISDLGNLTVTVLDNADAVVRVSARLPYLTAWVEFFGKAICVVE